MKHIKQDKDKNCAQACIAMFAGKDIREIEEMHGSDTGMSQDDVISLSKKVGIKVGEWMFRKEMKKWDIIDYLIPLNCFVYVGSKEHELDTGHLILRRNGKFFDPNGKQYYVMLKYNMLKGYIEIKRSSYILNKLISFFR